jgi:hypothetical protein
VKIAFDDRLTYGKQLMKRFMQEVDRNQTTLLPECLVDYVNENNPVRFIKAFVEGLGLAALGFDGVTPAKTARHRCQQIQGGQPLPHKLHSHQASVSQTDPEARSMKARGTGIVG